MVWFFTTLAAVVSQTVRNGISKQLSAGLSAESVSLCRFLFGLPLVVLFSAVLLICGERFSVRGPWFFFWAGCMAVSQIMSNALLVKLFSYRNFAISITLVKVETVIVALMGVLFLREDPGVQGWFAVVIGTAGLVLAAIGRGTSGGPAGRNGIRSIAGIPALLAFLSGAGLAVATVAAKKMFLHAGASGTVMLSSGSLSAALFIQSVLLLAYTRMKKPGELTAIFRRPWRPLMTGLSSGIGSLFWFVSFALAPVAYVRTAGQTEFILAGFVSRRIFREKIAWTEIAGMCMVAAGTVILLLG